MAKPNPNMENHPNLDLYGKQISSAQNTRKPSTFGPPLNSAPLPKRSTPHTTTKSPERANTAVDRRKSLQHGNEALQATSPEEVYMKIVSGDHTAELAAEIAEDVADKAMLQAKESRMKGTTRDKESLLEECSHLKIALADQCYHLQLHKVHHESVHLEQRRMEIAVEELEMANGLEAPRTGGPIRLKAKFLGLKCRQQEYFSIMTTLKDDFDALKKDPRVSFTNEADVERDVFATETRRLQKMVRRLRTSYHKVCGENNEVLSLRDALAKLASKIREIQTSLKDKQTLNDQMKKDIAQAKSDALESQKIARNAIYKAGELESHSSILRDMLTNEKQEGRNIHQQTCNLSEQTRNVRKENADRETAAKMAALAALTAAAEAAAAAAKAAGRGGKAGRAGKLKQFDSDADSASKAGSDGSGTDRDGDSADGKGGKRKGGKGGIGKGIAGAKGAYLKEIGLAATTFVNSEPASRPRSPEGSAGSGSSDGDHSDYEQVRDMFEQQISDGEERFLEAMDELQYGSPRPRKNARDEAKRLAAELEALKKSASTQAWLQSLTIQLDDQILKPHEYVIDTQESETNVRITSPGKTPEALAKKKAEDEARKRREAEEAKRREAEEAKRRAQEEEERRKKAVDDETARMKKTAEDAAKTTADADAKKMKDADEAAKKSQEAAKAADATKAAADTAAAQASASGKGKEFFDDKMQGVIKKNIKEVLGHLEVISESVQQKATGSGTAESTAKDVLDKLDKPK